LASSGPMDARPEAERLYLAKARDGDRDAQYNLALAYANGTKGMPQDDRNAVLWYRKSAEQGHPGAQNNLGVLYSGGRGGLPHSYIEAVSWYEKSAAQGSYVAQATLAGYLLDARAGEKNVTRAVELLRQAAEKNHPRALYLLGNCYDEGTGVAVDPAQAREYWQK